MKFNDLIQTDVIAGRVRYQRTPIGLQFLELYSKMALLLESAIAASPPI